MTKVAFALRQEYAGTVEVDGEEVPRFLGGVIAAGDSDLNVAELLEEGAGTIVLEGNDTRAVVALDEYPALKRVPVPTGAELTAGYADENVTALRAELRRRGITRAGAASKDEAVVALQAFDRLQDEGITVPAETSLAELLELDADDEPPEPAETAEPANADTEQGGE